MRTVKELLKHIETVKKAKLPYEELRVRLIDEAERLIATDGISLEQVQKICDAERKGKCVIIADEKFTPEEFCNRIDKQKIDYINGMKSYLEYLKDKE